MPSYVTSCLDLSVKGSEGSASRTVRRGWEYVAAVFERWQLTGCATAGTLVFLTWKTENQVGCQYDCCQRDVPPLCCSMCVMFYLSLLPAACSSVYQHLCCTREHCHTEAKVIFRKWEFLEGSVSWPARASGLVQMEMWKLLACLSKRIQLVDKKIGPVC